MNRNTSDKLILSKKNAVLSVLAGVVFVVGYKMWKIFLLKSLGLDSVEDYYQFQTYCSHFRIFGSLLSLVSIYFLFGNARRLFCYTNERLVFLLAAYVTSYFLLLKVNFQLNDISLKHFLNELYFNFPTGLFEELGFRVLIFLGLFRLLSFWGAAVLSSLLFSVWHYDVVFNSLEYISLFFAGLVFSTAFAGGAGLVSIVAVHFLWDQIHYGLIWNNKNGLSWSFQLILFQLAWFLVLMIFSRWKLIKLNKIK